MRIACAVNAICSCTCLPNPGAETSRVGYVVNHEQVSLLGAFLRIWSVVAQSVQTNSNSKIRMYQKHTLYVCVNQPVQRSKWILLSSIAE